MLYTKEEVLQMVRDAMADTIDYVRSPKAMLLCNHIEQSVKDKLELDTKSDGHFIKET